MFQMDTNTALVLVISIPITAAAIASAVSAKYQAQTHKVRKDLSHIHPIALIYRQMKGFDLKDESELEVEDLKKQIDDLQRQLNSLRDTATQFDLSIDHHLRELDSRMESVEKRTNVYQTRPNATDSSLHDINVGQKSL